MTTKHDAFEELIVDALARARETIDVPPSDPGREHALLAAFDAHHARRRRQSQRWMWTAAAASIAMGVAIAWPVHRESTPPVATPVLARSVAPPNVAEPVEAGGFIAWPGADALPPFESGTLVRVELPAAALVALGMQMSVSGPVVPAEIVVGQDGLARAVRFFQN